VFSWSAQVNATRCGEGGGRWFGIGRQLPAIALSPFVRQRLATLIASKNRNDLDALRTLIEDGAVTTVIDRVCSFPEDSAAMRGVEAHLVEARSSSPSDRACTGGLTRSWPIAPGVLLV
jgi:hypothetical protein